MATMRHFPVKTAGAIACCVAVLGLYRRFVDEGKGLSPAIFAEAAHVRLMRHAPVMVVAVQPVTPHVAQPYTGVQKPEIQTVQNQDLEQGPIVKREPVSAYLIDDDGSLDPFFAALHALEQPVQSGAAKTVTVLHYGDSPTTADLITGDVRTMLQARFGDAGNGYLLAAKPWAWYGHHGVDISDKGWKTSTAVGKNREEVYGLGGASFEGDAGASSRIAMKDQSAVEVAFLARPGAGTLSVSADGKEMETFSTATEAAHPEWHRVALPMGTKSVEMKPVSGSVRVFGESMTTGRRGLLYDSLGLNGASTTVLSNGFNAAAWAAALAHEQPALVIINYGTNESGYGAWVDTMYEPSLRTAIARIRAAVPGVAILVMSPMDRGERKGVDEIVSYDTIARIVAIQRRVAAEMHCGFFDTYDAMGGAGTMARWYTGQPRLVAGDLIHPTPQGATIVAKLFVQDLMLGYERYLKGLAQAAVPTPGEPAKILDKALPPAANASTEPKAPNA